MQNLNIDDGTIHLSINNDETRVISFNPKDSLFAEKFYRLIENFKVDLKKYEERAKEIDAVTEVDENQVPVNMQERFDLLKEVCNYFKSETDKVFGEGTSNKVFGDTVDLDMFTQFYDGISPFINKARTEAVKKYIPPVQKPKGSRRK